MKPLSLPLFAAAALAGCAATHEPAATAPGSRGDVFYRAFDAPAEDRYRLSDKEDFRLGGVQPDTRAVPEYPAAWLERAPREVWICTELHIDEQGAVYGSRALHPSPCNAAETAWDAEFRAAVDAATRQWRFEPSYRCVLAEGGERGEECIGARELTAVPVSRAFRFVFRRTASGGTVEGGETPP